MESAKESRQAAEEAIRYHEVITLSARDSVTFVEALLDPPEPNEALKNAFQHHRELLGEYHVQERGSRNESDDQN